MFEVKTQNTQFQASVVLNCVDTEVADRSKYLLDGEVEQ